MKGRREISSIRQNQNDVLKDYWMKFNKICNDYPLHGIVGGILLQYFYKGLMLISRTIVDGACGGSLLDKTVNEAREILDALANGTYSSREERKLEFKVPTNKREEEANPTSPLKTTEEAFNFQVLSRLSKKKNNITEIIKDHIQLLIDVRGQHEKILEDREHVLKRDETNLEAFEEVNKLFKLKHKLLKRFIEAHCLPKG
ncbi:hypothetical protein COLO4_20057 [Corchorus olitorius]|uniref:Retrotransposon gag protein n=1 Tax=Corchorus olitorius TaxID=93759 RepID=A0A1R3J1W5_9ROSI|nr:hypothetical protein COLO4_20057 [Corchorus olitorius]